ncbi:hypothetical protein [Pseudomonas paraeruginosa]|uniref:hypothetical protein n=1 Tax=Pseudomonas paraeruginosa TaxID=2994495 RepID=UPI0039FC0002
MSSTQHQLIEQCATRLRGIVEALDNIHDTNPQRWSTDLDDVHSSAESLLALINDQAPTQDPQGLAGNGSLRHPCPAHPAQVEQAGDERVIGWRERILAAHPSSDPGFWPDALLVEHMAAEIADLRAALAQPSPAQAEKAEAERPEVVAYRTIGRHEKHQHPHYALNYYKQNAEDQAAHWREVGCEVSEDELMTVAQHERIVKAWIERWKAYIELSAKIAAQRDAANARLHEVATACATAEQERDAALAEVERLTRDRDDCLKARLHYATQHGLSLARVAELTATRNRYGVDAHYFNKNLQRILRDFESFTPDELARSLIILAKVADEKVVAQAQHSAGYAEARKCANCRHIGINDSADYAACHDCRWTGPEPDEDKCPGCGRENCMAAACPECGGRYELVAEANITAPPAQAGQVPEEVRTLLSRAQCEIEHLAECLENVCEDEEDFDVREDVADGRVVAADIAHMLAAAPGKEGGDNA